MPELLALIVLSLTVAAWAYARARKWHIRLELLYPGFDAFMRGHNRRR